MTTDMSTAQGLETEIAVLTGEIDDLIDRLGPGLTVEMPGLDMRIAGICGAAMALPDDSGRTVMPALGDLMSKLEQLAQAVERCAAA